MAALSLWLLALCGALAPTSSGGPEPSDLEPPLPAGFAQGGSGECLSLASGGSGRCGAEAEPSLFVGGSVGGSGSGISFRPEMLEYSDSPVCIPTISEFTLDNEMDIDVHVYSIASDSSQFHPVSFQPQVLLPKDSLSIQLLFLPYHVKATDAVLTISTSAGEFEYRIIGKATSNPYRLHPFIGNKVIAGVPFEVPIVMFNPHDSVLHIREIFTTEEFLSLHRSGGGGGGGSLGSGSSGGDTDDLYDPGSWVLEAGGEREVIRLAMSSTVPGHYYGYVHVKTDKDKIVIPVDLQVLEGGLRAVDALIDFGIITQSNVQKSVELKLANSGSTDVRIIDIAPAAPDAQLAVEMRAGVVRAGMEEVVAVLVYNGGKPGKVSNKVLVTTDSSNAAYAALEVPYEASMLQGGIGFAFNQSVFAVPIWNESKVAAAQMDEYQSGSVGYTIREFIFTNFFSVSVSLQGISAATCNNVINVIAIPSAVSANRMESWSPVVLLFNVSNAIITSISKGGLPFTCWLELWTNISSHRIPLHVLDGDLNVNLLNRRASMRKGRRRSSASQSRQANKDNFDIHTIDFQTIGLGMPEGLLFSIENANPQRIPLRLVNTSGPICMCLEALVPLADLQGKRHDLFLDSLFPDQFVLPKTAADPNCSCYDSSSGSSSVPPHPVSSEAGASSLSAKIFKSTFGAFLNADDMFGGDEDSDAAGSGSGFEVAKLVRGDNSNFLHINAGHTAILSLHLQGLETGAGRTVVRIASPFQSKLFNISYSVLDGDIQLKPRNQSAALDGAKKGYGEGKAQVPFVMVMGRYQHTDILAYSTFEFPLPIRGLSASSPHFSVPPELSLPNLPARLRPALPSEGANATAAAGEDGDGDDEEEEEEVSSPYVDDAPYVVIGGLEPDFSCVSGITAAVVARSRASDLNTSHLVQLGILPVLDPGPANFGRKYPVWSCIRNILSKANVAVQRMSEGVGLPGAHSIGAALDSLDLVQTHLGAQRWSNAHDATLALADEWEGLYPDGFGLRPFNVTMTTDAAVASAAIEGVSVLLPSDSIPPYADIILPPSRVFEATEFYLKVVNPFDIYLSFSLAESDSRNAPKTRGTASIPTASPAVMLTSIHSKEETDFVPAMFPKTWVPYGCRRYSLHTPERVPGQKASKQKRTSKFPNGATTRQEQKEELEDIRAVLSAVAVSIVETSELISATKIAMYNPQIPAGSLLEAEEHKVELLTEKLALLEESGNIYQALLAPLKGEEHKAEALTLGRQAREAAGQVPEVKDALRAAKKELRGRTSQDDLKKAAKGGLLDAGKAADELSGGGISSGTVTEQGDHSMELTLMERSNRFKYAVHSRGEVMQFGHKLFGRCKNMSLGWCGYTNPRTEAFTYPAECAAWASLSDTPAAASPIVTGAIVNSKWPTPADVRAKHDQAKESHKTWSASPFALAHMFPFEVVVAPHSSAYLGPIKFETPFEGIFQKPLYVVNNYTGTDRVNIIAEAGTSVFVLTTAQYVPNGTDPAAPAPASGLQHQQTFKSTWNPTQPFGSSPILVNGLENGISVIARNEDGSSGAQRIVDPAADGLLAVSDISGGILYTFENLGILGEVIRDIEVNGKRLCETKCAASQSACSLYSTLCAQLPYDFQMNSSWAVRIPYLVDCSFASTDIDIRLVSGDMNEKVVYQTKHSTLLSGSMVDHCLQERANAYSESSVLGLIKQAMLAFTIVTFFFFWKKRVSNRGAVDGSLSVEGENVFGGVAEVFLKRAHDELVTAHSQRGRRATALGSAGSFGKKRSKNGGGDGGAASAAAASARSPGQTDAALGFEDLVRAGYIDMPALPVPTSPAMQGYENYLKRKAAALAAAVEQEKLAKPAAVAAATAAAKKTAAENAAANAAVAATAKADTAEKAFAAAAAAAAAAASKPSAGPTATSAKPARAGQDRDRDRDKAVGKPNPSAFQVKSAKPHPSEGQGQGAGYGAKQESYPGAILVKQDSKKEKLNANANANANAGVTAADREINPWAGLGGAAAAPEPPQSSAPPPPPGSTGNVNGGSGSNGNGGGGSERLSGLRVAAPPGITIPQGSGSSPRDGGYAGGLGSPSDGDLDFDPSDFNMLIDQDLRALLVKPQSASAPDLSPAIAASAGAGAGPSAAPPGFGPLPMHRAAPPADQQDRGIDRGIGIDIAGEGVGVGVDVPEKPMRLRVTSNSNFQERFINDLLLDDMSPLASDPSLQSFFSGMAQHDFFGSINSGGMNEHQDHSHSYGGSDKDKDNSYPYSSLMHLLDTEASLPLSLSSSSSPANNASSSARTGAFSPPKFGGPIAGSLGKFPSGNTPSSSAAPSSGAGGAPRGNLAASLTCPGSGDNSPGNPASAAPRRQLPVGPGGAGASQYPSLNSFPYPPLSLSLDTSVGPAKVPEKGSGGRYSSASGSPHGLHLASALPPGPGGARSNGSSPRIVAAAGPPGPRLGDLPSSAGSKSRLGVDIRSNAMAASSGPPPGLGGISLPLPLGGSAASRPPPGLTPPGLTAPLFRGSSEKSDLSIGDDDGETFFGKDSSFLGNAGRSNSVRRLSGNKSDPDDDWLQPLPDSKS
jgi:hypothetical protein